MHILFLLQTAFSLWMLVDAINRGCRCHWFWIIMMPFGEVAYFLAVKIHDPEFQKLRLNSRPKKSLKELQFQAKRTPSLENRLLLAQSLHDNESYDEAIQVFRDILSANKSEKAAQYGLARCLKETKQTSEAIEALKQIIEDSFSYKDYAAGVELAEIYWEQGNKSAAVEIMQKVVTKSQQIPHIMQLAQYLNANGKISEAHSLLEEAINSHQHSPRYVQKSERRFVKQAKRQLKALPRIS